MDPIFQVGLVSD